MVRTVSLRPAGLPPPGPRAYRSGHGPQILVTGTSRGIGKAIVEALRSHNVVGHSSSEGSEARIAADLSEAGAAERLWGEALARLGGRIDVLVNNAACSKRRRSGCRMATGSRPGSGRCGSTHRFGGALPAGRAHFREQGGGRIVNVAQPRRPSRRFARSLALCRVQSRHGRDDQTIARAYAAENILAFAVSPASP